MGQHIRCLPIIEKTYGLWERRYSKGDTPGTSLIKHVPTRNKNNERGQIRRIRCCELQQVFTEKLFSKYNPIPTVVQNSHSQCTSQLLFEHIFGKSVVISFCMQRSISFSLEHSVNQLIFLVEASENWIVFKVGVPGEVMIPGAERENTQIKRDSTPIAGLIVGQCVRRWPSIIPASGVNLVHTSLLVHEIPQYPSKHETSTQCWFNAGPPATGGQH